MTRSHTWLPAGRTPQTQGVHDKPYRWALALMILLFVVVFTRLAWQQHAALRTHKADLGQMDLAIWNSAHGRFLEEIKGDALSTRLTDHVEPILALVGTIFWLWNDVRALLLLQALVVALAAWPLYLLAGDKLGPVAALTLAAAYLLNPSLQAATLTDFHAIPLASPFILWAFLANERGRWQQFAIAALLLALVKEEAALLAAGLGAWAWWRAKRIHHDRTGELVGIGTFIIALIWFLIALLVIVPAHGAAAHHTPNSIYFQRYDALGDTPASILANSVLHPRLLWRIITQPARLRYLLTLAASFGLLPLLGPEIMLLALPLLLANLLSSYPAQFYGDFHYTAPLIPYLAVATIWGLSRLRHWQWRWLTAALLIWLAGWAGFGYAQQGRGPGARGYDPITITAHHQRLPHFLAQIPADAAVTATDALLPHLSHRRFIYQFPHTGTSTWALLDVTGDTNMAPGDLYDQVQAMLAADWGVVDGADGYLLLHRPSSQKDLPAAFYDFARTPHDPQAQSQNYPLRYDKLLAQSRPRWRQATLLSEWLAGKNLQAGTVRPWLELRAASGELLYTFDQITPPALIWYPPAKWQPGDRIYIETPALALPRYWAAGVAVVHGPDPTQPHDRLPIADAIPGHVPAAADATLALAGAWAWQDNALQPIPLSILHSPQLGPTMQPTGHGQTLIFDTATGPLRVHAWTPHDAPAPGQTLDFWLSWPDAIPDGYQPFIHLRQENHIIAQDDGPPRLFWSQSCQHPGGDWREILIPGDNTPSGAAVSLVMGLYNRATGQRLPLRQSGNTEALLARWNLAQPPTPDQSCALIPDTCASQPGRH